MKYDTEKALKVNKSFPINSVPKKCPRPAPPRPSLVEADERWMKVDENICGAVFCGEDSHTVLHLQPLVVLLNFCVKYKKDESDGLT